MTKIRQLDAHLTNMIAAGEVVERPAGIIKELVENALDAHATHVEITYHEGGMSLIEVSDNGDGMGQEDISHAFDRHSTSKILDITDLNSISSFGFRGEALPSIASVSYVEATSNNGFESSKIIIDNGIKSSVITFPRNKGTSIRITNLFTKVPARLKHIKNTHYESSIILDIIQKFALGNPDVSFTLSNEERVLFRSYGSGSQKDVFHRIYGGNVSQDAVEFSAQNYDFKITGVMALPQHNRSNRYSIWIYINGRMIRFPKIQKAVADAFRRHMPSDRYPIVVLNIDVDPQLVDVNVHPSKWEIRLSKDSVLIELILSEFEALLGTNMRPQRIQTPRKIYEQTQFNALDHVSKYDIKEVAFNSQNFNANSCKESVFEVNETSSVSHTQKNQQGTIEDIPRSLEIPTEREVNLETLLIEPLTVLSQLSGCYILAQGQRGLYIIDQHAAMERVRYEYFQAKLLNKSHPQREFLIPLIIEGRSHLIPIVDEINSALSEFPIELEIFGDDVLILRRVPMWIAENEVNEFINNVLDMFENNQKIREEDIRRLVIATLACHSSVRFNEYMSMEAMTELVEQLRNCEQPFHCPHGRPTFITVEHDQLIKEFKR